LQIASDAPPWLEIAGELWSKALRVRVAPDAREARRWSALAFGDEAMLSELSEKEMMVLARHGGAVSPVTSYLAVEPGVRPSTRGIALAETGSGYGSGEGQIGLGNLGTFGRGGAAFDAIAWLRHALEAARQKCGFADRPVSVTIETTLEEIVDVPAMNADGRGDRACLVDAVWSLELPAGFTAEHETYAVPLSAAR